MRSGFRNSMCQEGITEIKLSLKEVVIGFKSEEKNELHGVSNLQGRDTKIKYIQSTF